MTKKIVGFERYEISADGVVWNSKTNKAIKPCLSSNGYLVFNVRNNGKTVQKYLHRILLECFVPNPKRKAYTNHIDGNKLNNELSNLEWATPGENNIHAIATGLRRVPSGKDHCCYGMSKEKIFTKGARQAVRPIVHSTLKPSE